MRIQIKLNSEKNILIPISYNYLVQAMIYSLISNEDYASFLHDKGYVYENRNFKMFNFSKLEGKFNLNRANGMLDFYERKLELIISSPDGHFIEYIAKTLIISENIRIGNNQLHIEKVSFIDSSIDSNKIYVYTKTPIVVYSTLYSGQTVFYSPLDFQFQDMIKKNMLKKYNAFFNINLDDINFNVSIINNKIRKKVIKYKNMMLNGYMCELELTGDNSILKFAYDTGLGSKNSQGMGMINLKKIGGEKDD